MTITTTTNTVTYTGDGATTVWDFSFVADQASDMIVQTTTGGVTTTLDPSVYTLVINSPVGGALWGVGGSVTYPKSGSPLTNTTTITITRAIPYEQTISISNQGAFYPQVVEQALDILSMQIQQLFTLIQQDNP